MLHLVELPLQWKQTLQLLDLTLKIHSKNNNLILDQLAIVDSDAADNYRFYFTTMKALNFQNYMPSFSLDHFKEHYVLVFYLTSMQDATENFHNPELLGEPLRLVIKFTFPQEHVSEIIILGEPIYSFAADMFGIVEMIIQNWQYGSPGKNQS